jgi:hypothetical protein
MTRFSLLLVALVATAACAPRHPRLDWGVRHADTAFSTEGSCPATLRVRVVDPQQHPIAGAEVIVHQQVHYSAPSTVHVTTMYETQPAITDPNGVARTCAPDRVPPRSEHEMFVGYRGEITARLGERTGTLGPPFTEPLVLDRVHVPPAVSAP